MSDARSTKKRPDRNDFPQDAFGDARFANALCMWQGDELDRLTAERDAYKADAEFAASVERVLIRYIDRMNDTVPEDSAEKVLTEFLAEVNPLYTARFRSVKAKESQL